VDGVRAAEWSYAIIVELTGTGSLPDPWFELPTRRAADPA